MKRFILAYFLLKQYNKNLKKYFFKLIFEKTILISIKYIIDILKSQKNTAKAW